MIGISDLVAGYAYWFQCAARTAAGLSPFSTASQMVTAKRHNCRRSFFASLLKIKRSCCEFLPTFPSRPQLRLCVAPRKQSASVYQFVPWTFVKDFSKRKNARSARCDECLSASVYMFSSSAVKPSHGFMILNFMLEFEYLVNGCPTGRNVNLGIGISEKTGRQLQWLCVWWRRLQLRFRAHSTPQDMPLKLRLAVRSPLTCRQQVNLAEGPSTSTFGTQIMTEYLLPRPT